MIIDPFIKNSNNPTYQFNCANNNASIWMDFLFYAPANRVTRFLAMVNKNFNEGINPILLITR